MKETSKKIGISQPWFFNTFPYNPTLLKQQIFITAFFNNFGILVSDIYISEYRHLLSYHLTIFLSHTKHYSVIKPILNVLKSLLVIKYKKNISFNIKRSPSLYYDDKILGSWLKLNIQKDTMKVRPLIKKLLHKDKLKNESPSTTYKTYLKAIKMDNAWLNYCSLFDSQKPLSLKYLPQRISALRTRLVKNNKSLIYYRNKTFIPLPSNKKIYTNISHTKQLNIKLRKQNII
jgi:hypothetical protein